MCARVSRVCGCAQAVPEIDLVLGGHDHFYKADMHSRIVKSGEEFRWTSHVTIQYGSGVV